MTQVRQTYDPENYTTGSDRYVRFARDFLDLELAELQERLLEAVADNQRVLVWGANGPGKSYATAALKLGFLYTNPDSIVLGTSGSYGQYHDTMWKPLDSMHGHAQEKYGLPGDSKGGNQPMLELDTEWYCKVVSPRSPDELEGRHGTDVLVVIDEADKPYVTKEHFSSAGSSITDLNDKVVAICNPPSDETNVVYEKYEDPRWEVIEFSSFEARNVRIDAGELDAERIPGIVDLVTLADDWEAWNQEPWPETPAEWPGMAVITDQLESGDIARERVLEMLRPGFQAAKTAHRSRQDLSTEWYRRRAGVMPPDSAAVFRPFNVQDVEEAYDRAPDVETSFPQGLGLDVARKGGDSNALAGKHGDVLKVHDSWKGIDHTQNESRMRNHLSSWGGVPLAIDAQGEGSGLADRVDTFHDAVVRFNAGQEAAARTEYYDRWTEGLYMLGQFLQNGGSFTGRRLREELLAAARTVELEERYYKSREDTVFKATSKDAVRDALGRSPDLLDAAYMAVWAASDAPKGERKEQRLTW